MDQILSGFSMRRAVVLSVPSATLMMSCFLYFSVWYGLNSTWLQHEKSSGIISALCKLNDVMFPLFQCVVWTKLSGFSMRNAAVLSVHSMTLMMSYFLYFSVWYGPKTIWLQHEKSSSIISALYDHNDVIFPLFQCVVWTKIYLASA